MLFVFIPRVFSNFDSLGSPISDDFGTDTRALGLSSARTIAADSWIDPGSDPSGDQIPEGSDPWSIIAVVAITVCAVSIVAAIAVVVILLIRRKRRNAKHEQSWQDPTRYAVDSDLLGDLAPE
jgi:hypothetical protein